MSKITDCLIDKKKDCLPIWFMRQAGRYLPEFRKIRAKNKNFVKLCLNSELSSEITLQPIKRFDLDAAIIFSDILIVPHVLGQEVKFIKDKGPILSNIILDKFLNTEEEKLKKNLQPVYKAINITRKKLKKEKSLIAFVGAPWTLIVYMLGMKIEKDVLNLNLFKKKQREINLLLKKLTDFLCIHIKNQIDAGADVVQIFDSWAGILPEKYLDSFCYKPNLQLVNFCKLNNIPVICFPRGIKKKYSEFVKLVRPDGINIDYNLSPEWAIENLNGACIQGGMHPNIVLLDEKIILREAEKYLKIFKNYPYIFNLGHGLLPSTDPNKLDKLIKFVKNYK